MKEIKGVWAGVAAGLPALLLAATQYMEAQAQREKKADLADNYRSYIEEQMVNEEHLSETLKVCMEGYARLAEGRGAYPACEECPPCPELVPTDGIAAEAAPEEAP